MPMHRRIAQMRNPDTQMKLGNIHNQPGHNEGSALIVSLWVIMILAFLIGDFAFDMHLEAKITAYARQRLKAQYVARGGVEWAKSRLIIAGRSLDGENPLAEEVEPLSYGAGLNRTVDIGEGAAQINIFPASTRLNVNQLTDEEWENLLDSADIPQDQWPKLIDCFHDWTDANDEYRLNGGESDDAFYEDRGYKVKNAPLDTVDELLFIKGFSKAVVFGGVDEDSGDTYKGIYNKLTTWNEKNKLSGNAVLTEVLYVIPDLDPGCADDLDMARYGDDGIAGTEDDVVFENMDELITSAPCLEEFRDRFEFTKATYVRIESIGEVNGIKSGVWCVLKVDKKTTEVVYWREEIL